MMHDKELMRISCAPECGFLIQSHDEDEVVKVARGHVKEAHKKTVSEKEAKGMIERM